MQREPYEPADRARPAKYRGAPRPVGSRGTRRRPARHPTCGSRRLSIDKAPSPGAERSVDLSGDQVVGNHPIGRTSPPAPRSGVATHVQREVWWAGSMGRAPYDGRLSGQGERGGGNDAVNVTSDCGRNGVCPSRKPLLLSRVYATSEAIVSDLRSTSSRVRPGRESSALNRPVYSPPGGGRVDACTATEAFPLSPVDRAPCQ